jgi:hypothetical protein
MEEQLLGKKRGGDIPPAEETPASSSYVKDKEGRKNESTAHAEPQPANPAAVAQRSKHRARSPLRQPSMPQPGP